MLADALAGSWMSKSSSAMRLIYVFIFFWGGGGGGDLYPMIMMELYKMQIYICLFFQTILYVQV